ncbi:PAS modulated sigma54 specific transcriptional regulator, Fis family [Desulfonatronospira thiodismutans ASO3-1]|uniref:PAS modulated sigma54 specific transcriptional regulator, Fis family n=1 Tax=Desulfonatronospira thiodismutans ASO3-1 TaxID=555779 RepID=D6ST15_9BACT|nr:sigma-54-dependent Fis family transcriptional regulator [Desulfonatronospira thiodismutans]EFI33831.1 PAS modulated sigma54 specific transcriptional regulator, Fis family [Desulfonatronospira thiodismutans ASO3-1]
MLKNQRVNIYCKDIVEIMQEGLLVVAEDGTIQMVNHALENITGYSKEELLGQPCSIFKCDACKLLRQASSGAWCRLFERKEQVKRKCHLMRKDGSYITVLKTAAVLSDDQGQTMGAVEIVTDISEMDRLDRQLRQLTRTLDEESSFQGIVGHSRQMKNLFELVEKAAQSDFPVFICGESGTGKELVAQAIHNLSPRAEQPYIQVNCAALNESLLESELFGHVKGAFTGALQHRKGRFEAAHKGDIFLDEIGDLPMAMQVKLLRVLETKTFERVGDNRTISVDLRFITATNKNLPDLIARGGFREDLFYRINVIPIHLPPLRERKEDVPHLVDFFIKRLSRKNKKNIQGLSPEAMRIFMQYSWPGNVRELKSALEYSYVLAEGDRIRSENLPEYLKDGGNDFQAVDLPPAPAENLQQRQKQELIEALKQSSGNKSQAARLLGINRVTVLNRMRKYGIDLQRDVVY